LWLVLVATGLVALVLSRLRGPLERMVNWLAFGERANAYELVASFLRRMATGLSVEEVLPRLAETAARTVGSQRSEVRLWLADGSSWRQTWPLDAHPDEDGITVAVRHGGTDVGEIEVGADRQALPSGDRRLLDELAGPAGLALSNVRLTYDLRDRALQIESINDQLLASRQRIIEARLTEQVRIQAELDQRVRPHLIAAGRVLRPDEEKDPADDAIASARKETAKALEVLRDLARGIFPPRLADAGLVVALEGWADRAKAPLELRTRGDLERLRAAPEVEAAVYFCIVTALGCLLSDGGECPASAVEVTGGAVHVHVTASENGSGLPAEVVLALSDRAEAFAGRVSTATGANGGFLTPISVQIPLAWPEEMAH
jgi:signal transduction histidine kinase